ncbi:C-type lectin domain family 4 member M-like [Cebidichthys violaceus]|uniref:C-type lectin domain family 4 member M-like n=1 Tax=Cebidichthys violaceus TaxID=271503 RepID=UPI0035CB2731
MDSMEIDDSININKNLTMEGIVTKVDFQRRKQPSRCVTVCLGLLCAVLLAGNIGQFIYYEIISRLASAEPTQASFQFQGVRLQDGYDASAAERKQLEAKLSNLTEEKGQLQQSYTALTTERDEFRASFNSLTNENDQLQASYNTIKRESDQLQTSYNNMQKSHNNLTSTKDQLQTNNRNLQREKDELQNKYNSLVKVKDELEKKINKVRGRPCRRGWKRFDISCYFVSTEMKNWASSRADCIADGADLVIIDSRDEQVFVNGLLPLGQEEEFWFGMTDSVTEGTWMWVDGTPVTTTYWHVGQPNSSGGNQDCGGIWKKSSGLETWNDETCSYDRKFICEQ